MRVLIVGGYDFSAMEFENKFKGIKVSDIIYHVDCYGSNDGDDGEWELTVKEIEGDIPSDEFIKFAKSQIDYDHSKDKMWYVETETI